MSNLHTLNNKFGVSPWLDNLSRDILVSGELQMLVDKGICGVTSNPSIFEKSFSDGTHYSEPFKKLTQSGMKIEDAYWQLAIEDIQQACDILSGVYHDSGGNDGFVSLEVSPENARDAKATVAQAQDLWSRVNRPNLMIKIPATEECIPAISQTIALGINVNVTLIFSLHRYLQVITAYMDGLEKLGDPSRVRSVASFFVSRVDSEVDERLKDSRFQGIAAVAQARAAYGIFLESFNENAIRWSELTKKGAVHQRPLWASTSTKNPSFSDLKYVNGLLTNNSVNTLPNSTIEAILDHAQFDKEQQLSAELIEQAHEDLAKLHIQGIDMKDVSAKLENEGVEKFQTAFKNMLVALSS